MKINSEELRRSVSQDKKLFEAIPGSQRKIHSMFYADLLYNFFSLRHVLNMIHVNNFGCLASDLNLTVFSMAIFLSMFKRRFPSTFYNIRRSFQSC